MHEIPLPLTRGMRSIAAAVVAGPAVLIATSTIVAAWRLPGSLLVLFTGLLLWRRYRRWRPVVLRVGPDRRLNCTLSERDCVEVDQVLRGVVAPGLIMATLIGKGKVDELVSLLEPVDDSPLLADLRLPDARSIKDRRQALRAVVQRLRNRLASAPPDIEALPRPRSSVTGNRRQADDPSRGRPARDLQLLQARHPEGALELGPGSLANPLSPRRTAIGLATTAIIARNEAELQRERAFG